MTTKKDLQAKIEELESQLTEFKHQLSQFKEYPSISEASAGDTLEDGSVVIYNPCSVAIVIAPKETERLCEWRITLASPVYNALVNSGFLPSQWFIPTVKQLQYAMVAVPEQFKEGTYWTSEKFQGKGHGGIALGFNGKTPGNPCHLMSDLQMNVRAFRCIFH
jgi:hypothetical protein